MEQLQCHGLANRPVAMDNLLQTGTTTNYKTLFLQRLANPSAAWDPVTNPYLTIDWLPVDLTVFNGEDQHPPVWRWTAPNPPFDWDVNNLAFGDRTIPPLTLNQSSSPAGNAEGICKPRGT